MCDECERHLQSATPGWLLCPACGAAWWVDSKCKTVLYSPNGHPMFVWEPKKTDLLGHMIFPEKGTLPRIPPSLDRRSNSRTTRS